MKPVFVNDDQIENFENDHTIFSKIDISQSQINELKEISFSDEILYKTQWVFFPWSRQLLKTLDEISLKALRTNRNKNLITESEQEILYNSTIALAGLSVGSGLAIELQYSGIANNLVLAESDMIETINLNRMKAKLRDVGIKKLDYVLKEIYELNPYAHITSFSEGVNEDNIDDFLKLSGAQIIIEIIDDYVSKVRLRLKARDLGIPVISFANLGDSVLVDVERYDIDKSLPLFNGVLGDLPEDILKHPEKIDKFYAVKLVGKNNVPQRALDSVEEIGKTLIGRPQLSSTVAISSALGAYISRNILLGDTSIKGRHLVKFDSFFK